MAKRVLYEDVVATVAKPLEDTGSGFRFEALLSVAGQRNRNQRIYPLEVMQPAVERAKARLKRWPGTSDHPELGADGRPKLSVRSNAVLWEDLWWAGNELWGRGLIIETVAGLDLKANIKAGVEVGFSTRGKGIAESLEHPDGPTFRMREYDLTTIDAVVDPSVLDARVGSWSGESTEDNEEEEFIVANENLESFAEKLLAAGEAKAAAVARAEVAEARIAELQTTLTELKAQIATANEAKAAAEAANQTLTAQVSTLQEQLKPVTDANLERQLESLTKDDVFGAGIIAKIHAAVKAGIVTLTQENVGSVVETFRGTVLEAAAHGNGSSADPKGNPNAPVQEGSKYTAEQRAQLLQAGLILG